MKTFNEWANTRITLSFQEKYNMLMNRLSSLLAMKTSADFVLSSKSPVIATTAMGCCGGYGINGDKTVDEIVKDVDLMWTELKKEIVEAVKTKEKAMEKQTKKDKNA